jgi:excisionase family DNA binding protein
MDNFEPRFIKVSEYAELMRIHKLTVLRLIKRNEIRAVRVGGHWRILKDEINGPDNGI